MLISMLKLEMGALIKIVLKQKLNKKSIFPKSQKIWNFIPTFFQNIQAFFSREWEREREKEKEID